MAKWYELERYEDRHIFLLKHNRDALKWCDPWVRVAFGRIPYEDRMRQDTKGEWVADTDYMMEDGIIYRLREDWTAPGELIVQADPIEAFDSMYRATTCRDVPIVYMDEKDSEIRDAVIRGDRSSNDVCPALGGNPISVEIVAPQDLCNCSAILRTFEGGWGCRGNDGDTEILLDIASMQVGDRTWAPRSRRYPSLPPEQVRIHVTGDSERLQLARVFRALSDCLYTTNRPRPRRVNYIKPEERL